MSAEAGVIVRGSVAFACRATAPTPGAHIVQVHVVIEQRSPAAPRVHAYLPMGHGAAGMDRADQELARIRRGAQVEAQGHALTVTPSQPDALWLRGCVGVELVGRPEGGGALPPPLQGVAA